MEEALILLRQLITMFLYVVWAGAYAGSGWSPRRTVPL